MAKFQINVGKDEIDELCDTVEETPGFDGFYDSLKPKRAVLEEDAKISSNGRSVGFTKGKMGMLWLASVPAHIMMALARRHGWDYFNSVEFTSWLKKHPQFMMGRSENRSTPTTQLSSPSSGNETTPLNVTE